MNKTVALAREETARSRNLGNEKGGELNARMERVGQRTTHQFAAKRHARTTQTGHEYSPGRMRRSQKNLNK
jgi:hypothetical protein